MRKLNYLEFAQHVPTVAYTNVGAAPITFKFFNTGFFGQGYYQLTANGKRHPQKKYKLTKQVWNEYQNNRCIILP